MVGGIVMELMLLHSPGVHAWDNGRPYPMSCVSSGSPSTWQAVIGLFSGEPLLTHDRIQGFAIPRRERLGYRKYNSAPPRTESACWRAKCNVYSRQFRSRRCAN